MSFPTRLYFFSGTPQNRFRRMLGSNGDPIELHWMDENTETFSKYLLLCPTIESNSYRLGMMCDTNSVTLSL